MNNNKAYIDATQTWLQTVIIKHNICPFAKNEFDRQRIRFTVDHNTDIENILLSLMAECDVLDSNHDITTTLLIYASMFADFHDYLDFVTLAESLLIEQGYEGIYQLASFHPDYCFENALIDDAANYTNRSPYPMLHLLRESSIEYAVNQYPEVNSIPENNIQLTRKLGLEQMRCLLAACYVKETD
jgi:hypothetical protein